MKTENMKTEIDREEIEEVFRDERLQDIKELAYTNWYGVCLNAGKKTPEKRYSISTGFYHGAKVMVYAKPIGNPGIDNVYTFGNIFKFAEYMHRDVIMHKNVNGKIDKIYFLTDGKNE